MQWILARLGVALLSAAAIGGEIPPASARRTGAPTVLELRSAQRVCDYTLPEIESMGLVRVNIEPSMWPGLSGDFQGVPLPRVLAACGMADEKAVNTVALNGYSAIIPREDWQRWPVIVATRKQGKPIPLRAKGPLLILYVADQREAEANERAATRWTWMLMRIESLDSHTGNGRHQ